MLLLKNRTAVAQIVGSLALMTLLAAGTARAGVWSNLGNFSASSATAIAADPGDPAVLYAGMQTNGVYKTTDGGSIWTPANTGLTSPFILSLLVDATTPATLYVGTNGHGVFKSTDGALNWSPVNTGLGDLNGLSIAMDPTDALTLYVGTFAGVFKTTDGAANWAPASTGLTNLNVFAVVVDPNTPTTVYAATNGGGVFVSVDGAANWTASNSGLPSLFATKLVIDPNSPSTLFVGLGTTPSVHKSIDGGATWSDSSTGLTSTTFSLAVDPTVTGRVWAGMGSGVHLSDDGGATWFLASFGMADPFNTAQALLVRPGSPTDTYAGVSACCGDGPVYRFESYCGDGQIDAGEMCDDANFDAGDGCDASCQVEACYSCDGSQPSVCAADDNLSCDDGDLCTTEDECSAGACIGEPVVCPACEACSGGVCGAAPRVSCAQVTVPGKSKLSFKDKEGEAKDGMVWKWSKGEGVTMVNLGDPVSTTDYALCVYDDNGAIALRADVPAGGTCQGKPCWKESGGSGGYVYSDKDGAADGITKLKVKAGVDAKAKALVKGKGVNLDLPDLTSLALPLLVQLQPAGSSMCIEATFSSAGVKKTSASQFKAVSD